MSNNSEPFDQDLREYLAQVRELDLDKRLAILGMEKHPGGYYVDFFSRRIHFDRVDFMDLSGEALTGSIKGVLCQYLIRCPESLIQAAGRLVTLREFPDSGPLFSRFTENKNKTVEQAFSGQLDRLLQRCNEIGGRPENTPGYDLSVRFRALPKIPVLFHFNDKEETLPAQAAFLFEDHADKYLDLKSLGILATYLTGLLIQ
jgi:hypothetical protein